MITRIILIALFTFMSQYSLAQKVKIQKNKSGEYQYQQVFRADSTSKEEIFDRLNQWVAKNYVSANDVIQYKDKDNGKIIAKGNFITTNYGWEVYLKHTLTLETKENRFRVTFDQLKYETASGDSPEASFSDRVPRKKKMLSRLEDKISDSVNSMLTSVKDDSSDDW